GETSNMAEKAIELLNNTKNHEYFRKQARKRAIQYFNADQIITQYETFYKEILDFE
ncbi:unnamed protein product, partial [marine sediment metagenome]